MARLFFSYCHRDEALRDELEVHFATLKRQGVVTAWHDRRIEAGNEFDKEISHYLEGADIVVLLVSADFLNSDYCYEVEIARAMERHERGDARVIPVILRPCDWHEAPFGKLLAVPRDGKPVTKYPTRDEAFLEVVGAIRAAATQLETTEQEQARATLLPTGAGTPVARVRSSNLRVRKTFSDQDRDEFLEESFEYLANFFEGSLAEFEHRNEGITTKFRRTDANHFTAAIYRNGAAENECRIWLAVDHRFLDGICYSCSPSMGDNSFNESLAIEDDGYSLFLKARMGSFGDGRDDLLSQEGAAEHFWEDLIRPLQESW